MTAKFRNGAQCPTCGTLIANEPPFSQWLRNHPELESHTYGLSVMDADYIFHRYRTEFGRKFQCLMMVEVKTQSAEMTPAQRDTAGVISQILRNRRQTPTKRLRYEIGTTIYKIFSAFIGAWVRVRVYGFHVLTFDGFGPEDSKIIKWDREQVTADQLVSILKFDLDPDEPNRRLDYRSHHRKGEVGQPALPMDSFF